MQDLSDAELAVVIAALKRVRPACGNAVRGASGFDTSDGSKL